MLGKLSSLCRGFSTTPLASRLLRSKKPWSGSQVALLVPKGNQPGCINNALVRHHRMIPKNQYDIPNSMQFFNPFHMLIKKWELSPIYLIILYDFVLVGFFICWFYFNKVDINWTPGVRNNISRTMNLRCPTIHKLMVMEPSVYRPWPEMQDVLDAMAKAELQIELLARIDANKGKGSGDSGMSADDPCKAGSKKKKGMC